MPWLPSGTRSQMLGEEVLNSAPCIRGRYRLWSGVGQFHHWAESQRPVRFVVQEGVTGEHHKPPR
jgi:hypothetical protein